MVYFLLPENRLTWPASGSWDSGTPGKNGKSRRYLKKNFIKISGKSDLVTTQRDFSNCFRLLSKLRGGKSIGWLDFDCCSVKNKT